MSEKEEIKKLYLKNIILTSNTIKTSSILIFIIGLGLIVRFNYIDFEIPLTLDSFRYFLLGIDTSILGNLPSDYDRPNTGWSSFLSLIFQMSNSENFLDYMALQRICTVSFSVITAIPMYFLAKKFFRYEIALVGSCFYIFSPYIIENSLLGITDSLFIFLTTTYLALFFSKKKLNILSSFVVLGLATVVRYESMLLIIPTAIIFVHKYLNHDFRKFVILGVILFLIVIISVMVWKVEMGMPDGILSHLYGGASVVINENSFNSNTSDRFDIIRGMINLPKFFGLSLLPICFIFVPYSLIYLVKKQNTDFRYLIIIGMFSAIPALYAYGRGFDEVRYVLFILPILVIASLFLVEKLDHKIKKKNLIVISLIILIIISSIVYLDIRKMNYQYEKEAIDVARYVLDLPGKTNDYGRESYYVEVMDLEKVSFPILSTDIKFQNKIVNVSGETIQEILENFQDEQVSYIGITEENSSNNLAFEEIYNEKNSNFKMIYNSAEIYEEFKIKIFKINFD